MIARALILLLLSLSPLFASAMRPAPGEELWWVFLRDRGNQHSGAQREALLQAAARLDSHTVQRRAKGSLAPVGEWDLATSPASRRQVEACGARIRVESRWLNALSVMVRPEQLAELRALPCVRELRPVARGRRQPRPVSPREPIPAGGARVLDYGASLAQLDEIDVPRVHEAGFNGAGVRVLMLDTGFFTDHEALHDSLVLAEWDFINGDGQTQNEPGDDPAQHSHGTLTFSTLGGSFPGQLYGPAWGARFLLAKTEDVTSETPVEEDYWIAGLEWGESLGADVVSSSLGYTDWYTPLDLDGQTAPTCLAAEQAFQLGMVLCNSAGNARTSDWGHIVTPADGLHVIAVGAVNSSNLLASFSSPGPTADGRIKPEVCARGVGTVCAGIGSTSNYRTANGTSLSCPLVAGAAALVVQAHPGWSPLAVREALMNTADRADSPDNDYGWGRIRTGAAIEYLRAPENLSIRLDASAVRLDWNPGVADSYRVYSAPTPAGPWTQLVQLADTTWSHATALDTDLLCYRITAAGIVLP